MTGFMIPCDRRIMANRIAKIIIFISMWAILAWSI